MALEDTNKRGFTSGQIIRRYDSNGLNDKCYAMLFVEPYFQMQNIEEELTDKDLTVFYQELYGNMHLNQASIADISKEVDPSSNSNNTNQKYEYEIIDPDDETASAIYDTILDRTRCDRDLNPTYYTGNHYTFGYNFISDIFNYIGWPVKIKYTSGATRLKKITQGDWIDVYAAEYKKLYYGDKALISLGFSLKMPCKFEAILAPRSSTFKSWGVLQTNSIGVIDNSYNGDGDVWKMPVCLLDPDYEEYEVKHTYYFSNGRTYDVPYYNDDLYKVDNDGNLIERMNMPADFKFRNYSNLLKIETELVRKREKFVEINPGDKIGQMRILTNQPKIRLIETNHLSSTNRGGFGSTGTT